MSRTGSSVPGTTDTPADSASWRARTLSPAAWSASGGGPIQTRPDAATASATSARSLMNPYPGWIAWHPFDSAASMTAWTFR